MEDITLTSIGMLKKIGHPSYKFLEWNFRAAVFEFCTNYWSIVQGRSGDEALVEYWKDIFNLLELDAMTWRQLIIMVRQGAPCRARATLLVWDLLHQSLVHDHVDLNHIPTEIIGDYRNLENVWKAEHIIEIPEDCVEERLLSGPYVKSAWQVLRDHHDQHGPHGSGTPDDYILMQKDRIMNLHLAFQSHWSTSQDLSWASMSTQTSSSSSVGGQGLLRDPRPRQDPQDRKHAEVHVPQGADNPWTQLPQGVDNPWTQWKPSSTSSEDLEGVGIDKFVAGDSPI